MKIISKIVLVLSVALASISCGPSSNGPVVSDKIVGEWHLVSVSGIDKAPEVYVSFAKDLTFELFQKTGDETHYRKYEGTYAVSGSELTGRYADGESWGSGYKASFEGDALVLTAQNGSGEVCTYEKKALSESDKADALLVTRSAQDGPRFL